MKNLYHKNKGKVHPSLDHPLPNRDVLTVLKLLPAAILALLSVLSLEDREVLAYLITRSIKTTTTTTTTTTTSPSSTIEDNNKKKCKKPINNSTHKSPIFECGCFDCYTSYWYKWDSSPNRELIHQAIEAFEDHLAKGERSDQKSRGRKRDKAARRSGRKQGNKVEQAPASFHSEPQEDCPLSIQEETEDLEENRNKNEEGKPESVPSRVEKVEAPADAPASAGVYRAPARKIMPDVFGLFNSRFWSVWNPNI